MPRWRRARCRADSRSRRHRGATSARSSCAERVTERPPPRPAGARRPVPSRVSATIPGMVSKPSADEPRRATAAWPALARVLAGAVLAGASGAAAVAAPDATPAPRVETVAVGSASSRTGFEIDASLQALRPEHRRRPGLRATCCSCAVQGRRPRRGRPAAGAHRRARRAGRRWQRSDAARGPGRGRTGATPGCTPSARASLRAQGFVSQAALDVAETQLKAAAGRRAAGAGAARIAGGAGARLHRRDGAVRRASCWPRTSRPATWPAPAAPIVTRLRARRAARRGAAAGVALGAARAARRRRGRSCPTADACAPASRRPSCRRPTPVSQTVEWRLDLPPTPTAPAWRRARTCACASPAPGARRDARAGADACRPRAVLRRGELTAVYVRAGRAASCCARCAPAPTVGDARRGAGRPEGRRARRPLDAGARRPGRRAPAAQ
ncbi:MAG: hypothetical protein MZW92_14510 [Comamonadaceae bacterium]|nr:hypothetical protein [Comamonadaceae bacterium]